MHEVHLTLLQVAILGCDIADQARPLVLDVVNEFFIIREFFLACLELSQSLADLAPPKVIHLDRELDNSLVNFASDIAERPRTVGEHRNEFIDEIKAVAIEEYVCEFVVLELLEALVDNHKLGEAGFSSLVVRIIGVPGHLHLG